MITGARYWSPDYTGSTTDKSARGSSYPMGWWFPAPLCSVNDLEIIGVIELHSSRPEVQDALRKIR